MRFYTSFIGGYLGDDAEMKGNKKEPCGNKALSSEDWYTGLSFTTLFWFCYLEGLWIGAVASMIGLIFGKYNILERPILWIQNPLKRIMLRK